MPITPRDIRDNEFAVGIRGYDRDEVHSFLAKVANDYERVLDAVSSAQSPRETGNDDFGVLAAARAGADDIIQQAAAEAEYVRQQAADEAERVRQDAAEEATSIRQRAREEAARLLAEAKGEAEAGEELPPSAPGEVAQMLADAAREAAALLEEAYDQAADQLQKAEGRALEITEEAEKQCREALEEGRQRLSGLQAHDRDLTVAMTELERLVAELQERTTSLLRGTASGESARVPSE